MAENGPSRYSRRKFIKGIPYALALAFGGAGALAITSENDSNIVSLDPQIVAPEIYQPTAYTTLPALTTQAITSQPTIEANTTQPSSKEYLETMQQYDLHNHNTLPDGKEALPVSKLLEGLSNEQKARAEKVPFVYGSRPDSSVNGLWDGLNVVFNGNRFAETLKRLRDPKEIDQLLTQRETMIRAYARRLQADITGPENPVLSNRARFTINLDILADEYHHFNSALAGKGYSQEKILAQNWEVLVANEIIRLGYNTEILLVGKPMDMLKDVKGINPHLSRHRPMDSNQYENFGVFFERLDSTLRLEKPDFQPTYFWQNEVDILSMFNQQQSKKKVDTFKFEVISPEEYALEYFSLVHMLSLKNKSLASRLNPGAFAYVWADTKGETPLVDEFGHHHYMKMLMQKAKDGITYKDQHVTSDMLLALRNDQKIPLRINHYPHTLEELKTRQAAVSNQVKTEANTLFVNDGVQECNILPHEGSPEQRIAELCKIIQYAGAQNMNVGLYIFAGYYNYGSKWNANALDTAKAKNLQLQYGNPPIPLILWSELYGSTPMKNKIVTTINKFVIEGN